MYKNNPLTEKPLAVIFDLSGTLIDSQRIDHEALNHVLESHGLPAWSETRKKRDSSKSIKDNFPNFFGQDADRAYKEYIDYLLANKDQMNLFPGVRETLQFLKENEVPVIIISNRDKEFVTGLISYFGISNLISHAIGAGDTAYSKPDKRLFEFALEAARISARGKNVLFVGDAMADMYCAEESEAFPVLMRAVKTDVTDEWVTQAQNDRKNMWIVADYSEFLNLLKKSTSIRNPLSPKDRQPKRGSGRLTRD